MVDQIQAGGGIETTGRYLVLLREDQDQSFATSVRQMESLAGLKFATSRDFDDGVAHEDGLAGADAVVFEHISVAVMSAPPEQDVAVRLMSGDDSQILAIEPEQILYALQDDEPVYRIEDGVAVADEPVEDRQHGEEYVRGYADGVEALAQNLIGEAPQLEAVGQAGPFYRDTARSTWGIQAVGAINSKYSGEGINIAVLDTGLDLHHPDFQGRNITTSSFIQGESVQDGNGHGTHCIGTSMGGALANGTRRYGVAGDANLFAGKVLSNAGSGADGGILNGINWAIDNNCAVISMSLGASVAPGQGYSPIYERVAQRAMTRGSLIIAAAGNESRRPRIIRPVGRPANCPSIMTVAAVDSHMRIARFSNGGLNPDGGNVDIAGPGVDVYSTWPMSTRYRSISGTSMATPHVSGVAGLFAQQDENARGYQLAHALMRSAQRLSLPSRDVGSGLVQAP